MNSAFPLIFRVWKRIKASNRYLKIDVDNGKCDNMGNANKTVIHTP